MMTNLKKSTYLRIYLSISHPMYGLHQYLKQKQPQAQDQDLKVLTWPQNAPDPNLGELHEEFHGVLVEWFV